MYGRIPVLSATQDFRQNLLSPVKQERAHMIPQPSLVADSCVTVASGRQM